MGKKFIPNGDLDFSTMAHGFATTLAKDPGRYHIAPAEADELVEAVQRYRAALQKCRFGERSMTATRVKEEARHAAELIIRRLAHVIRANPKIDAIAKLGLGLKERAANAKPLTCPQEPPRLRFLQALHRGAATPMHELKFSALDYSARPPGAVRLELFVDLVPPDEPLPAHPGANHGSRPWYLRSYTKSPIVLVPPMARVPMRMLYWGRWADSTGAVGPFSATVAGWIEGGTHHVGLPGAPALTMGFGHKPVPILEDARDPAGPATRERTYVVAVMEAQYHSMNPRQVSVSVSLPAPPERDEPRRLEGPQAPPIEEAA